MRTGTSVAAGLVCLLAACALLALGPGPDSYDSGLLAVVALVVVFALFGALVKVAGSPEEGAGAPWADEGALVESAPERSPTDHALSGETFAAVVEEAGERARDDGTVQAGYDVVRPHLRQALVDAYAQGGTDRATAEGALSGGEWTDDRTAAAVLDGSVVRPTWSLRERFEAWLFPEQVVRRDVRRAVQAVAEAADDELPAVPGRTAPRTVPVVQPRLESLKRGADGRLQPAVDPLDVNPTPGDLPVSLPATDDAGSEAGADGDAEDDGTDGGPDPTPGVGDR